MRRRGEEEGGCQEGGCEEGTQQIKTWIRMQAMREVTAACTKLRHARTLEYRLYVMLGLCSRVCSHRTNFFCAHTSVPVVEFHVAVLSMGDSISPFPDGDTSVGL